MKIKDLVKNLKYPKFFRISIDENIKDYKFILDLGCGMNKIEGSIGVDKSFSSSADVIADIYYLPFKENSIDLVIARFVLEHLDEPIKAFNEIHRVLKRGGRLRAIVPHAFGRDAIENPTHKSFYTLNTILYFCGGAPKYYSVKKFKLSFYKLRVKINPPTFNSIIKKIMELFLLPLNILIIFSGFVFPRFFEEFIKLPFFVGEIYFEFIKE